MGRLKKYEKEICCTCSRRRKLYRNNSYDEFERVTEDGDFPAIEDYCRVVGRYDTEDEAFESLNHIDGDVLVYDTVKQELFN